MKSKENRIKNMLCVLANGQPISKRPSYFKLTPLSNTETQRSNTQKIKLKLISLDGFHHSTAHPKENPSWKHVLSENMSPLQVGKL